jgi:predicted ATPase
MMSAKPNSFRSGEVTSATLPPDAGWLVGRDAVVRDVVDVLAPGRLFTLTGTGGVGKTSIALDVARVLLGENERFTDGVWFCAMASVDSAASVPAAIADAVGMNASDEISPYDSIVTGLSGLWGVLIVDNCEQVASAMAGVLQQLIQDCPDLVLLVTSREPLRVAGEEVIVVDPLDVDGDAEELFVRRAIEADPNFERFGNNEAIASVCGALDGLPLALELAAARIGPLSVDQVDARLGERFRILRDPAKSGRGDSLHATVSWSYDLLDPMERHVFDRLSVFHGGFDDASAAAMMDPLARSATDIRVLLGALVDKSMISLISVDATDASSGRRYDMLETLRQFGDRQLARRNERAGARNQHLDLVIELVAAANARALGESWAEGAARFRREWANIRAAVGWAIDTTRVDDVDRLLRDVHFFCRWTLEPEATLWAQRAIDRGPTTGAIAGAPAHLHVGFKHFLSGDHPAALQSLTEGLAARGTPSDRGWCRHYAAVELLYLGRAVDAAEQAAVDFDDGSARTVESIMRSSSITTFGMYAQIEALDTAAERAAELVSRAEATGNAVALGHVVYNLALIEHARGNVDAYLGRMNEALAIARSNGIANLTGYVLTAQVHAPGWSGLSAALEALDHWQATRNVGNEYVVLEAIGINLAELGRFEPAAMILGNVRSGRRKVASSLRRREAALAEIAVHRRADTWMAAGAAMSRGEVIGVARRATVEALAAR